MQCYLHEGHQLVLSAEWLLPHRWDLAMAQLPAAEFGLPILRSTNRGPVGWIDANGRVRALSERFGRHAECQDIWAPDGVTTLYTYITRVAAGLPAAIFLLLGWAFSCRRRKNSVKGLSDKLEDAC